MYHKQKTIYLGPDSVPYVYSSMDELRSIVKKYGIFIGEQTMFKTCIALGNNVIIGANISIGENCILCDDVEIGDATTILPTVQIGSRTIIGKQVVIESGTIIGDHLRIKDLARLRRTTNFRTDANVSKNEVLGENIFSKLLSKIKKTTGINTIVLTTAKHELIVDDVAKSECLLRVGNYYNAPYVSIGTMDAVGVTCEDLEDLGILTKIPNSTLPIEALIDMTKSQKVIFLDIDGALNIISSSYSSHTHTNLGHNPIEKHLMLRLELILERVLNSVIVISSSWSIEDAKNRLNASGFKYSDKIIGHIDRCYGNRCSNIVAYVEKNSIREYIVLEDEVSDVIGMDGKQVPKHRVIEVDPNEGLSHVNTVDAVTKLNNIAIYDGLEFDATRQIFKMLYKVGYRPQVNVPLENEPDDGLLLVGKWSKIEIHNDNLEMRLLGKDDE